MKGVCAFLFSIKLVGHRKGEAAFVSAGFENYFSQMADHAEVLRAIRRNPSVKYTALTPNLKGFNSAVSIQVFEFVTNMRNQSEHTVCCTVTKVLVSLEAAVQF